MQDSMSFSNPYVVNPKESFTKVRRFGEGMRDSLYDTYSATIKLLYFTTWQVVFNICSICIDIYFLGTMFLRMLLYAYEAILTLIVFRIAVILIHLTVLAELPEEYITLHLNLVVRWVKNKVAIITGRPGNPLYTR